MPIIKCKMCGGDLNLVEGSTVCECEYCGTKQTVPSADNEKKLTLFGRAGRLLRACEFDKAAGVFETIVADFTQEAEAYWGLVLCKYGIEYVDDPATGKKIPTCHRSSFDSVLDDPNFEQACENTDAVARRVYRDEARQIEELRQAILQVSGKEEPYDVFISYKETDANGERTLDSVIAQDIYKELTNEGYRVFFSRISLEDKLGTEYEPYIFAALNSAKVMLVVGTDYENFDAVWVKNEWSRFLKLIAKGEKKTLIPVFKNMDAYDMPKEFAKLSAQDMGKVGAMQDLIRGVEKIVGKKKAETAAPVQQPMYVSNEADAKTAAAVKRGRLALEEGNWSRATEYFEQALTLDAECAEAYFGMALAEAECPSAEEFSRRICSQTPEQKTLYIPKAVEHIRDIVKQYRIPHFLDENEIEWHYRLFDLSYTSTAESRKALLEKEKQAFESNRNLSLAYRFAKGAYKETLENYKRELYGTLEANAQKAEREEQEAAKEKEDKYNDFLKKSDREIEALNIKKQEERGNAYQKACQEFEEAKSSSQFKAVKAKFEFLLEYKDSEDYISRCNKKITEVEAEENKERLYASCSKVFGTAEEQTIKNWESAKSGFESLGDYKDAPALAEKCAERITQLKKAEAEAEEQKRLAEKAAAEEAERQRILAEKAEKEHKAKKKRIGIIIGILSVIAIAVVLVLTTVIIPRNRYKSAEALFDTEHYQEAALVYGKMGDYKEARDKSFLAWNQVADRETVSVSVTHFVGIKTDGKVIVEDIDDCDISDWNDIIAVSAGDYHIIGLKADGSVVSAGATALGRCDVYDWNDIVAISAGGVHTVGLKKDGTVVAAGSNENGQCDVSDWTDIVAISAGRSHTVGLKADGTVVAVGSNAYGMCDVYNWSEIIAISAGIDYTVGLRSDGTVVAVGNSLHNQCDVSDWNDIISIVAGASHTVGLKKDGTVVAVGSNKYGQCDVSDWDSIVAVSAGGGYTIGLKADGTIVFTGGTEGGERVSLSDWTEIKLPNT